MKRLFVSIRIICLLLSANLFTAGIAARTNSNSVPDWKDYSGFDTIPFDFEGLYLSVATKSPTTVNLDFGQQGFFKAEIKPCNLYLKDAQVIMHYDEHKRMVLGSRFMVEHQWMGYVSGTKRDVRLNIYKNRLSGYINLDTAVLYFETLTTGNTSRLFIYNGNSYHGMQEGMCGVKDSGIQKLNITGNLKRGLDYAKYDCSIIKITGVISYDLFKNNSFDTTKSLGDILDRLNMADGIYSTYIHVRVKLVALIISLDSMAVYNTSAYAGSCLTDFKNKLSTFKSIIAPDVCHLFLKDFVSAEGAVGISNLGATCNSNAASLTMSNGNLQMRAKIFCHELGHNLNADHSDGINCSSNRSIMCPTPAGNTPYFGQQEINVISTFINNIRKYTGTPAYCLNYPRYNYPHFLDLCTHDSALFIIKKDKDFYLTAFYYEDSLLRKQVEDTMLWIKRPGTYRLVHSIDTVNSPSCSFDNEFFACGKDFKVTNTSESGIGSLKQAILNSNLCRGKDTITFHLPDSINYFYIHKLLPPLMDSCVIDGTSQPGYKAPGNKDTYLPSVVLVNKIPVTSDRNYGIVLSRESYLLKGLEINGFGYGLINYELNYSEHPYSPYYHTIYKNNSTDLTMYASRLLNNERMMVLNFQNDTNKNNLNRFGDGTLKNANFFLSNKAGNYGIKILNGKESVFDNNYFGIEAGTDSLSICRYYISLSSGEKNTIVRNYFGNTIYTGIESLGAGAVIRQNKFGFNPFKSVPFIMTGAAFNSPINLSWPLEFGGSGANDGNFIFNNKCAQNRTYGRFGPISGATLNNFRITNNTVINPDTTSILLLDDASKPIKYLILDSATLNCKNNNSLTVYGHLKTKFPKDTVYIHYYTVPERVKSHYEPMQSYKGYFTLSIPDTSITTFFTHTIKGCSINEGLVATVITSGLNVNSQLSNVVYPAHIKQSQEFASLKDTCLCPGKSISYLRNAYWDSVFINDKLIKSDTFIDTKGIYKILARDSNGCLHHQLLMLNMYEDFFKGVKISGPKKYKPGSVDTMILVNYKNTMNWSSYHWSGYHANVKSMDKYSCVFTFLDDTAIVNYTMTDINRCDYLISDTLMAEKPGSNVKKQTVSDHVPFIYPNPSKSGLFRFSSVLPGALYLYDANGRIILKSDHFPEDLTLDLSTYPQGIYFIRTGNNVYYKLVRE